MRRGNRGRVGVAVAAVMAVALLGGPVRAADPAVSLDEAPLLPLAGETVVHASGATALRLDFPVDLRFENAFDLRDKVQIELRSGSVAFVGLDELGRCTLVREGWRGMCMGKRFWQFPPGVIANQGDWPHNQWYLSPGPHTVTAGPVDLFVVTDGEVTVTLRVPGLDGRVEVDARGGVEATLVVAADFPVTCPAGDCQHLGWGGLTHEIGPGPGYASIVAQARVPSTPLGTGNPGPTPVRACAYPNATSALDGSPEPDDHPTGCDLGVATEDQRSNTISFLGVAPNEYTAVFAGNGPVDGGRQYLGFAAGQVNAFEATQGPGWYRADAVWLTQAYTCPADSGCFTLRQ